MPLILIAPLLIGCGGSREGLPACSSIWRDGGWVPVGYRGCVSNGATKEPSWHICPYRPRGDQTSDRWTVIDRWVSYRDMWATEGSYVLRRVDHVEPCHTIPPELP